MLASSLRPYQKEIIELVRVAFRSYRSVCMEMPTGSGKSVVMREIINSFIQKNKTFKEDRHIYFLCNETFLLYQFGKHVENMNIPHDIIGDGYRERKSVNVHVTMIQTLRNNPPENNPSLFIIDEAQWSTSNSFMDLFFKYPDVKILGVTASPEGPGGKGLSIQSGCGIYEHLIKSPVSMRDLTEMEYLCPVSYWAVPTSDYDNAGISQGDYKTGEIDKLIAEKGVFGDVIKQIARFPQVNDHILIFCKSVKACYALQEVFFANRYRAEVLEGSLTKTTRNKIMNNFESGEIQVLITCKMVLQGVDLPALLMCVDVAPTLSRMIWRQKVGRLVRPFPGKTEGIYLDMVGNIQRATKSGWVYEDIDWNFDGKTFNKRTKSLEATERFCPICYAYIPPPGNVCPYCGAERPAEKRKEKEEKVLDGDLVKLEFVPLKDRPIEERRQTEEAIAAAIRDGDIDRLREIGNSVCQNRKNVPFFVYRKMNQKSKVLDIPLLYRIQKSFGYKASWVHFAKQFLKNEG